MLKAVHQIFVVGSDYYRCPHAVELFEQIKETYRDHFIDVSGGLIGEQQPGAGNNRACNSDALLLTAGECWRARFEMIREADPTKQFGDVFLDHAFRRAGDAQGQGYVVKSGEMIDQTEVLENDADLPAHRREFIRGVGSGVSVEQADEPATGSEGEVHQPQKGRFPGATGSGDEMERAVRQVECDVAEDFRTGTVTDADIFKLNHAARALRVGGTR